VISDHLIQEAREGDEAARGTLLEAFRSYMRLLARIEIGRRLQGKLDASDLVQDAFLDAHRNFHLFKGTSEPEFAGWLRQILAARVCNLLRHYFGTQARDVRLEREVAANLDNSSRMLEQALAASVSSPSQQAVKREQASILADALEQLPADYREVLVLRHLESLSFGDVATRMGRSLDSVEKLWVRALVKLRSVFGEGQ
jgi:RNA polymerase sigma-70 factor, ECF subfamily